MMGRPASAARLERREGRGSAHRNRAEPEAARQVPLPATAIGGAGLSGIAGASASVRRCRSSSRRSSSSLPPRLPAALSFMQKQVSVKLPHGSQMATLTLGIEAHFWLK